MTRSNQKSDLKKRPNFLIFVTDQQRADHLGCMGNGILQTPNIDKLAAQGALFRQAYVNNPLCMPSRATLFTGLTPRGHGVRGNGIPLAPHIPTMPGAFSQAGYRTHNVGKVHLRPYFVNTGAKAEDLAPDQYTETQQLWVNGTIDHAPKNYYGLDSCELTIGHGHYIAGDYLNWLKHDHPELLKYINGPGRFLQKPSGADQSFKWALPAEAHHSSWVADRTIAFLREQAQSEEPFFTFCSFPDPHHPFCPPAPWCDQYHPNDVQLPRARRKGELDTMPWHYRKIHEEGMKTGGRFDKTQMPDEHLREIIAHTYGMVSQIDHNVGRVLDELDRLALAEDTVVVYLTDHGELMGDHWLINKGPFLYRGLTQSPFVVRWPGKIKPGTEIHSLTSHLDFAPTILDLADVAIPEGPTSPVAESPGQAQPWPGFSLKPLLTGQTDKIRDRVLIEYDEDYLGWRLRSLVTEEFRITIYPGQPFGELFDLQNDPDELYNLWDEPSAQSLKQEGLTQLLDELALTDSALPRRLSHA